MSSPWFSPAPSDTDSLLGPTELDAVRRHLGEDYRAEHVADVVAQVRGYCAGRGGLGAEGTIPPECAGAFRHLLRYSLLSALPVGNTITEARQRQYENALTFLRDIGAGKVGITRPAPAETGPDQLTGPTPPGPSICALRRLRDRRGLDGS